MISSFLYCEKEIYFEVHSFSAFVMATLKQQENVDCIYSCVLVSVVNTWKKLWEDKTDIFGMEGFQRLQSIVVGRVR